MSTEDGDDQEECDPIIVAECVRTDKPVERFDAEILDEDDDRDRRLDEFGVVQSNHGSITGP